MKDDFSNNKKKHNVHAQGNKRSPLNKQDNEVDIVKINNIISTMAGIPINKCGHKNINTDNGCKTCLDCGWSACSIF